MTSALTSQQRVFKPCLTQRSKFFDDVTHKIGPLDLKPTDIIGQKVVLLVIKNRALLFFSWTAFNSCGSWNKPGGGAKNAKSINVEVGIFWKKLVHNCNKLGVEDSLCK